jgi:hypothetical protein
MNDRQCRLTNNKIVVRSRGHRCNGKATMPPLCNVEMHVTVDNTDLFDDAKPFFYGQIISPTIQKYLGLLANSTLFFHILTKLRLSRQIS